MWKRRNVKIWEEVLKYEKKRSVKIYEEELLKYEKKKR